MAKVKIEIEEETLFHFRCFFYEFLIELNRPPSPNDLLLFIPFIPKVFLFFLESIT